MFDKLQKLFNETSELINSTSKDTRFRVISHYDADGIISAAIISKMLKRLGFNFHVTLMRNPFDKGLEKVAKEKNEITIFTDMGSGQIDTIEELPGKKIILDHHQYQKEKTNENTIQINANLCGINGNYEACGSSLSYGLAKTINEKNIDLIALAVIGITGDKQYIGGIRGYNGELIKEGIENKIIYEKTEMKLSGRTIREALYYSVEPFFANISGNQKGTEDLLKEIKIKQDAEINKLTEEQINKLHSVLMLKLLKKGCEKNILDTVIRKRYYSDDFIYDAEAMADLLDSCGKGGNRGLGLSVAMGDKESFIEASKLELEYKQKILDELIRLEEEGFKEKESFRYFLSNDSSLGGVIAGIAANFIINKEKPLISIIRKNNEIHVSGRGNQYLVKKGLDLGRAMKKAAQTLKGHGGGHAIASGATIKSEKEEEFLNLIDEIISKQILGQSNEN